MVSRRNLDQNFHFLNVNNIECIEKFVSDYTLIVSINFDCEMVINTYKKSLDNFEFAGLSFTQQLIMQI